MLKIVVRKPVIAKAKVVKGNVRDGAKKKTLPKDEYAPLAPIKEVVLSSEAKLVFQLRRGGDLGLPCVDIRVFVDTTEKDPKGFKGFTKKGFTVPLEHFEEFSDACLRIVDDAIEQDLFSEVE
jgi:hypothetical protein